MDFPNRLDRPRSSLLFFGRSRRGMKGRRKNKLLSKSSNGAISLASRWAEVYHADFIRGSLFLSWIKILNLEKYLREAKRSRLLGIFGGGISSWMHWDGLMRVRWRVSRMNEVLAFKANSIVARCVWFFGRIHEVFAFSGNWRVHVHEDVKLSYNNT